METITPFSLIDYHRITLRDVVLSFIDTITSFSPFHISLGLLFFLPFLDFTGNNVFDVVKHLLLSGVSFALLIYTVTYVSLSEGHFSFPRLGFSLPLALYSISAFASVVIAMASARVESSRAILSLITLPLLISLLYVIPQWFHSKDSIIFSVRIFLYSLLVVDAIGLVEVALHFIFPQLFTIRISSVFHDPNIFARFLVMGIFIVLSLLLFDVRDVLFRRLLWVLLLASIICLFFTLSRSGLGTFFFGSILFSILSKKRMAMFIILSSALVGIVAFLFLLFARPFEGSVVFEPSNINRIQLILAGIDMIRQHWLFGVGYTNFSNIFTQFYLNNSMAISLVNYEMLGYQTSIHNWLIEVWAEQGIIGLSGFVWFFIVIFRKLKVARIYTNDNSMKAILLGYTLMFFAFLFHGFFYHTFFSQFHFWVLAGFGVASIWSAHSSV